MKSIGVIFSNIHDKEITELTGKRTLASIPFGGRYRLIDFPLSNMVNSGITKVGVITKVNYQSLMDHVGNGKHWDLSRKTGGLMILPPYGVDDRSLYKSRFDAICGIENFLKHSNADYVVMSDCDTVCNFNFADAVKAHEHNHADITVIVYKTQIGKEKRMHTAVEYGADKRVVKVTTSDKLSGEKMLFTNMMVISRTFLLQLIENAAEWGYASFSRDVLVRGCREHRIFAYEYEGYFAAIDSLPNYYARSLELLDKQKRDELFYKDGANIYTKVRDSAPARLIGNAVVNNSLVADGCVIEGTVRNSILFRGVKVARGAVITDSIVFQDSEIGEDSHLHCVIADKTVRILGGRTLSGHQTHPYFIAKGTVI